MSTDLEGIITLERGPLTHTTKPLVRLATSLTWNGPPPVATDAAAAPTCMGNRNVEKQNIHLGARTPHSIVLLQASVMSDRQ